MTEYVRTYNATKLSFIETRLFTKLVNEHLSDEEYVGLQEVLSRDPETGDLIPGSGGVRKVLMGREGAGKARRHPG